MIWRQIRRGPDPSASGFRRSESVATGKEAQEEGRRALALGASSAPRGAFIFLPSPVVLSKWAVVFFTTKNENHFFRPSSLCNLGCGCGYGVVGSAVTGWVEDMWREGSNAGRGATRGSGEMLDVSEGRGGAWRIRRASRPDCLALRGSPFSLLRKLPVGLGALSRALCGPWPAAVSTPYALLDDGGREYWA